MRQSSQNQTIPYYELIEPLRSQIYSTILGEKSWQRLQELFKEPTSATQIRVKRLDLAKRKLEKQLKGDRLPKIEISRFRKALSNIYSELRINRLRLRIEEQYRFAYRQDQEEKQRNRNVKDNLNGYRQDKEEKDRKIIDTILHATGYVKGGSKEVRDFVNGITENAKGAAKTWGIPSFWVDERVDFIMSPFHFAAELYTVRDASEAPEVRAGAAFNLLLAAATTEFGGQALKPHMKRWGSSLMRLAPYLEPMKNNAARAIKSTVIKLAGHANALKNFLIFSLDLAKDKAARIASDISEAHGRVVNAVKEIGKYGRTIVQDTRGAGNRNHGSLRPSSGTGSQPSLKIAPLESSPSGAKSYAQVKSKDIRDQGNLPGERADISIGHRPLLDKVKDVYGHNEYIEVLPQYLDTVINGASHEPLSGRTFYTQGSGYGNQAFNLDGTPLAYTTSSFLKAEDIQNLVEKYNVHLLGIASGPKTSLSSRNSSNMLREIVGSLKEAGRSENQIKEVLMEAFKRKNNVSPYDLDRLVLEVEKMNQRDRKKFMIRLLDKCGSLFPSFEDVFGSFSDPGFSNHKVGDVMGISIVEPGPVIRELDLGDAFSRRKGQVGSGNAIVYEHGLRGYTTEKTKAVPLFDLLAPEHQDEYFNRALRAAAQGKRYTENQFINLLIWRGEPVKIKSAAFNLRASRRPAQLPYRQPPLVNA